MTNDQLQNTLLLVTEGVTKPFSRWIFLILWSHLIIVWYFAVNSLLVCVFSALQD